MNQGPCKPKNNFPWEFVGAIFLLFFTVLVLSLVFFLVYFNVSLSDDWIFTVVAVGIAWLAFLFRNVKASPRLSKIASETILFVKSGEPKGFTFEVLMNFLSNITIVFLIASISSVMHRQDNLILHICGSIVWLIAIVLSTMTTANFSYHIISREQKNKRIINSLILLIQTVVLGTVFLLFYVSI